MTYERIPGDIIAAIKSERSYQEQKWGRHKHSVAEWLLILEKLVADARHAWVTKQGDWSALDEIRQITATGVACMEQCGCPMRPVKAMTEAK